MGITNKERQRVELNIYENRAKELSAAVIQMLKEHGRLNYPDIQDAIVAVATQRFRQYEEQK